MPTQPNKAHTPGPWCIDWNVSRLDIFSSSAETLIASVRRSALSSSIDETAKANARLIAAAPELLDAAIKVNALSIQSEAHKELRAAIARATGASRE